VGTVTADEKIGPAFDTPTLSGLYDSSPYFHDGSIATLNEALTYPSPESEHNLSNLLSEPEIQDLISFLLALPFDN
jgi:cytochrome c peroxidase